MSNVIFRPVRGTEQQINAYDISEGHVYFATDTGKIFIDSNEKRIPMGGAGVSIYWGNVTDDIKQDQETTFFPFPITGLSNSGDTPKIGDIIINIDGSFYRIHNIVGAYYLCSLLAISGGGGGGAASVTRPKLVLEELDTYDLINGQDARLYFTATSDKVDGVELFQKIIIKWQLSITNASGNQEVYYKDQKTADSGVRDFIDFGQYLRDSTISTLTLQASASNHEAESWIQSITIKTSSLELGYPFGFSYLHVYNPDNVVLSCEAKGNTNKILDFYFDNKKVHSRILKGSDPVAQSYTVPKELCTHGSHAVRMELYQSIDGKYGLGVAPISYEIPIREANNTKPIIWLGPYQSQYYNYDSIQIPYTVFDPLNTLETNVHLYKNNIEINGSPIKITDFENFTYWEIADADLDQMNHYSISCGEEETRKISREIMFKVVKDESRSMEPVQTDYLQLNFIPTGRTNNESKTSRQRWEFTRNNETKSAIFENFNWYNNGWRMDPETNQTCLRISNGAKFTIPFGDLKFATSNKSEESNSIEIQFKMRNIQKYQNLITNITRYNYIPIGATSKINDELLYQDYLAHKADYINYDAYLQRTLQPEEYETLEYRDLQKDINLESAVIQFFDKGTEANAVGIGVGPQDIFFSNGTDTVSVPFVEEQMINLSCVYNHSQRLLFIYINGCISGVIRSSLANDFKISSGFIVNSKICDIDIYKIRIYNTGLTVQDICYNYAADRKDVEIWDQTGLASYVKALDEFQLDFKGDNGVEAYNNAHPKEPLMPYLIYDTSDFDDNRLPWSKEITRSIKMEFVNTPLEQAYRSGEIVQLAKLDGLINDNSNEAAIQEAVKLYYKHHCPSWTSTLKSTDRIECVVQGTSSQFYPRRNYKVKTKVKDVEVWDEKHENSDGSKGAFVESDVLNIYMHMGPYADIYSADKQKLLDDEKYYGHEASRLSDGWYMNNYTNPTDRWTMKVDYMESSGSYNAGLAGLLGNAYSKHPLEDYMKKGLIIDNKKQLHSYIAALSKNIRWEDYRTSLLGFPVMAFQKRADGSYLFIGYYRMLLDKGSDQVLGFKPGKDVVSSFIKNFDGSPKRMRDIAECWEFSNNSRTFCSYKDPWKRVQLSFKGPEGDVNEFVGGSKEGSTFAPFVTDHFEYRYHWAEDYIDPLLKYAEQDDLKSLIDDLNKEKTRTQNYEHILTYLEGGKEAARKAADVTLSFYENWEKVCAWIYSTNIDNVPSSGSYSQERIGLAFNPDKTYYVFTNGSYVENTDGYQENTIYFEKIEDENLGTYYLNANIASKVEYIYQPNKFYQKINGAYSLISDEEFNPDITYYVLNKRELTMNDADLLVAPATSYSEEDIYYTYNSSAIINPEGSSNAVTYVGKIDENTYKNGKYYIAAPVTYSGISYDYDTKEYRAAKFINELKYHFDEEYLATYFVVTEILECYDSRGKNCMMASWGPQEEGGEYIWYPIFYDMDTQLGINNTGIPSFEYNVDATENNNFSTSDSVLWNNFYRYFRNSLMLNKYKHLRGLDQSKWTPLKNPPFESVENIEKWYTFDPTVSNNLPSSPQIKDTNIVCRGKRPLIATNLDMYFKFITITNPAAKTLEVSHLSMDGVFDCDIADTYFYALQGDRSQSRQQFVLNRLDYTDSWLKQKNYARAGANYIRGRISANNMNGLVHSDNWVEKLGGENPSLYYDEVTGKKVHDFDAEYWVTLTPTKSIYVTAGEDGANYPSRRYNGVTPIKFEITGLESGIRTGEDYPEQLLYLYGTKSMADYGDLHNLYYREFVMVGEAPKLTRLKLGHDGLSTTDFVEGPNGLVGKKWFNNELNQIGLVPLPLLKEMNISNIGIKTSTTLNLTESEKLENFRATGTKNLNNVIFADGVALNTLYLPESTANLTLVQANLLTDLITDPNEAIPRTENGTLIAKPGLYLENFFKEHSTSSLATINLVGGSLGYNSYRILQQYYVNAPSKARLSMSEVNWCPYVKVVEGDKKDNTYAYFKDSGHYQLDFININTVTGRDYDIMILNNELYKIGPYVQTPVDAIFNSRYLYFTKDNNNNYTLLKDITSLDGIDRNSLYHINTGEYYVDYSGYQMLKNIYEQNIFSGMSSDSKANITGIIYIENEANNILNEQFILNTIQKYYPGVTFFFKNVNRAYTAKFINYDIATGTYTYVKQKNGSTIPSVQRIQTINKDDNGNVITSFESPFDLYKPEKTHYDFLGWSLVPNPGENDIIFEPPVTSNPADNFWVNGYLVNGNTIKPGLIKEDQKDYTFYAIFTIHKYRLNFYNDTGTAIDTYVEIPSGNFAQAPLEVPYKDSSNLDTDKTYDFIGYSLAVGGQIIDLNTIIVSSDEEFYANFVEKSIYESVHPEWFNIDDNHAITPNRILKGKITIPAKVNNIPVETIGSTFAQKINNKDQLFTHIFCQKIEDENGNMTSYLTRIADDAFKNYIRLQYFDFINTNIRIIGSYAFSGCPLNIGEFRLNEGLLLIKNHAFAQGFRNPGDSPQDIDWNITIPNSVQAIGYRAFANLFNATSGTVIGQFNIGDGINPSNFSLTAPADETLAGEYSAPSISNPIIRFNYSIDYNGTKCYPVYINLNKTKYQVNTITAEEKSQICIISNEIGPIGFTINT